MTPTHESDAALKRGGSTQISSPALDPSVLKPLAQLQLLVQLVQLAQLAQLGLQTLWSQLMTRSAWPITGHMVHPWHF